MSVFHIARNVEGKQLRKRWANVDGSLVELKPTDFAASFSFETRDCLTLRDVHTMLGELENDPSRCIIFGKSPVPIGTRSSYTFEDQTSEFMLVDIDSVPMGDTVEGTIIRCLPFLRGKAFVYYFSGSSGFKAGLRVRVVFRTPSLNLERMKFAARQWDNSLVARIGRKNKDRSKPQWIDYLLYKRSGIVYTAKPELLDVADPHPVRLFMVDGDEAPVALDLPKTAIIKVGINRPEAPPLLRGTWSGTGDQRYNSVWPYAVELKAYLGSIDFEKKATREKYWQKALAEADATPEAIAEFTPQFHKACKKVQGRSIDDGIREIEVVANEDSSIPLAEAEMILRAAIEKASQSFNHVSLFIITPGLGKTTTLLKYMAWRYLEEDQFQRPMSATHWYMPTIEMCEEACTKAIDLGLKASVRRGRQQEGMCAKAKADALLAAVGESSKERLCKDKEDNTCEFFDSCAYRRQFDDETDADIIFMPHSYLTLKRKADQGKFKKPALVVIDEAPWMQNGNLIHVHEMPLKTVRERDTTVMHEWIDGKCGRELEIRRELFCDIAQTGLTIEKLRAAGFTEAEFRAMWQAEQDRKPKLILDPSMSAEQSFGVMVKFDDQWFKHARVWKQMERSMRDGHLHRIRHEDGNLYMHWRSEIDAIPKNDEGILECPVILLDATARDEVVSAFLPVDRVYRIDVQLHPGTKVTRIKEKASMTSRLYGIRGLEHETDPEKIEKARVARERDTERAASKTLITYKAWHNLDEKNIHAHFGAIRGLNKFENRDLHVVGRVLPEPRVVENIAQAIFPREIGRIKMGEWYPQRPVQVRGGSYVVTDYHPDPDVEAVRWMICEGEATQAAHRGRPIRHPVELTLVNNLALPITVTDEMHHDETDRTAVKALNVAPLTERDMLKFIPNKETARKFFHKKAQALCEQGGLIYAYRVKGARGPMSLAVALNANDLAVLGEIVEAGLDEGHYLPYNQKWLMYREVRDWLIQGGPAWLENLPGRDLCWEDDVMSLTIPADDWVWLAHTGMREGWPWHPKKEWDGTDWIVVKSAAPDAGLSSS